MEGLGISISAYDPKTYLSQITIFEKRKLEGQTVETKYGIIDSKGDQIEAKKLKLEEEGEEQNETQSLEEHVRTCMKRKEKDTENFDVQNGN